MIKRTLVTKSSVLLASLALVVSMITSTALSGGYAVAQNSSNSNMSSASVTNASSSTGALDELDKKMAELESSNNPKDIATLAYIWGYPLVRNEQTKNYATNPLAPAGIPGNGPINGLYPATKLVNSSITIIVSPNVDTLYSPGYLQLDNEPIVLTVPPGIKRYHVVQMMDAYTNVFGYVGTRTTDEKGGTYLITGPNWQGQVPSGMTEIKAPTNLAWIIARILVQGPDDVNNVVPILKQITTKPLSQIQSSLSSTSFPSTTNTTTTSASTQGTVPKKPTAEDVPKLGIKVFDEISLYMKDNMPPSNESNLLQKFATIGVGPGKIPSVEVKNTTILNALNTSIPEAEKLITARTINTAESPNGWKYDMNVGDFGTDYLLRAATAKTIIGANVAEEALYPTASTDTQSNPLNGTNNYVIHFNAGQLPPVKGFWSVTAYNKDKFLVDNPINRYNLGNMTKSLKYGNDGSLDIYVQNTSPGTDKESNWLPIPADTFSLTLRFYIPEEPILNEKYQYPTLQVVEAK